MFSKYAKNAATVFAALLAFTIVYSLIYNQPIRFRPKMALYEESVHSLHTSEDSPDQIMLSPAENSGEAVRVSWRTSTTLKSGEARYWEEGAAPGGPYTRREARLEIIEAPELKIDRLTHSFSATLENLKPGAAYTYVVGDPAAEIWSRPRSFTMPVSKSGGFSFIHFGDIQGRPDDFGELLAEVNSRHPETAFYMLSGDLVEEGDWRYMWDAFAAAASDVFSARPAAPTLGNHDYRPKKGFGREYFQGLFNTPDNGPDGQPGSYSFRHGNVDFIVLDSNRDSGEQKEWLKERLEAAAGADFKIVMFHHPPYGRQRERRNREVAENWAPLFDRYGVDLVLNGHDHVYTRTKKMRGGQAVEGDEEGVTYIVANSGEKFYWLEESENAIIQLADTSTYQLITVEYDEAANPVLHYKARDFEGRLIDEFTIGKKRQ